LPGGIYPSQQRMHIAERSSVIFRKRSPYNLFIHELQIVRL